jgi:hypothetical protein
VGILLALCRPLWGWLLKWLADQPGATWQEGWLASRAGEVGGAWRDVPIRWLQERGRNSKWLREEWTEFLGHFELRKVATGTCSPRVVHPLHPRAQLLNRTALEAVSEASTWRVGCE